MPRATDGAYSLPSGTLVASGDVIQPSQHNPAMQDIATSLTNSLSRDGQGGMRNNLQGGGFRAVNFAPGIEDTDLATVGQINTSGGVPVGSVVDYAGSTAPTGWLFCAGQALSRTEYADLFAAIGTTYGAPNGTTFNIPDARGRVTAGRDINQSGFAGRLTTPNSQTLGAAGGAETVTLTEAQMPSHTHAVTGSTNSAGDHAHTITGGAVGGEIGVRGVDGSDTGSTGTAGAHSHTISVTAANTGGGQSHANVQPTLILNKIIKAVA